MAKSPKELCRHIFANQHKLRKLIQQQGLRYCSSTARLQEAVLEDEPFHPTQQAIRSTIDSKLEPIVHDPDVGRMFKFDELHTRLASPNELQQKPDADDLKFGRHFTDHMLRISYHRRLGGWQAPEITPIENLSLHPAAKVFHYALELFEGMKAYRGVDGRIRLFRPAMNMARMNLTAHRCGLPTFDNEEGIKCLTRLVQIEQEWVPHTESASLYIRPTLIGIEPTLGVASSDSALFYTILSPAGKYFSNQEKGVSLLADPRFVRAWPGGCGDRKMGSNYGPTIRVQKEAARLGLEQVLWLYGDDHQLTEVGTMNIFMYYINDLGERELRTPCLDGLILPGITRDSVLRLTQERADCRISEGKITMKMVQKLLRDGRCLELFGAGTACIVSPIERIHYAGEDLLIPTMKQENPFYMWVKNSLTDIQYGKIDHPWAVVID